MRGLLRKKSWGIGWVFGTVVLTGSILKCVVKDFAVPEFSSPAFSGVALSVIGLVSLFLGLIYQRRFQRADELIREFSVIRERMHPDYRALLGYTLGWQAIGDKQVDPRWKEKHEQTSRTLKLLREYRQLFSGVPMHIRRAVGAFSILLAVTVLYWFLTYFFTVDSHIALRWLNLLTLGITTEGMWHLYTFLRRVVWFSDSSDDRGLDTGLGIPTWYQVLDCKYLHTRNLPIAAFLLSHECYLTVCRQDEDWLFSLQLPMPIHGWEWDCRIIRDNRDIVPSREGIVGLSPARVDQFFQDPGLWLDIVVGRVPGSCLNPGDFNQITLQLDIKAAGQSKVFRMICDSTSCGGSSGWYHGRGNNASPHRYPYWRPVVIEPDAETGTVRLIRPTEDTHT